MKNLTIKLIVLILFGLSLGLNAQIANPASGGNASSINGSISYSVGQIFYYTAEGTNGSVTQGVQQPYEISVVSGIEDARDITFNYQVYPNPTSNNTVLTINNYSSFSLASLSFALYDNNGKLLENKIIENSNTIIDLENFSSALFFLKVTVNNKVVKTFKIIKNC